MEITLVLTSTGAPARAGRSRLHLHLQSDAKCAAALSGVMSRCGMPSISNPTMNLRIVAERSSGG